MRIVYRLLGLAADMVEAARSWVFSLFLFLQSFVLCQFIRLCLCLHANILLSIFSHFEFNLNSLHVTPAYSQCFFLFLINLIAHLVVICWCESENCCLFNASISMLLPFHFISYVNLSSRVDISVCVSLRCVPVNALHFLIILLPWV